MFVTPERVKRLTGYEVNLDDISIAQGVLETYIGRSEATVEDADDFDLLAKATAYQSAYMKDDPHRVFEMAKMSSISQDASTIVYKQFDEASPFIAPLAQMALRQLTWKKSRSIHTGPIHLRGRKFLDWKRD